MSIFFGDDHRKDPIRWTVRQFVAYLIASQAHVTWRRLRHRRCLCAECMARTSRYRSSPILRRRRTFRPPTL